MQESRRTRSTASSTTKALTEDDVKRVIESTLPSVIASLNVGKPSTAVDEPTDCCHAYCHCNSVCACNSDSGCSCHAVCGCDDVTATSVMGISYTLYRVINELPIEEINTLKQALGTLGRLRSTQLNTSSKINPSQG